MMGAQCDTCRSFAPSTPAGWYIVSQIQSQEFSGLMSVLSGAGQSQDAQPRTFCSARCVRGPGRREYPMTFRILVTGSRDWTDRRTVADALLDAARHLSIDTDIVVVHGACKTGADAIAQAEAELRGWETEPHPADWAKHGRAAGPIRNTEMVGSRPDAWFAFILNGSPGARDCADKAEAAGIPVRRFTAGGAS